MDPVWGIRSSINGRLGGLHVLAVGDNATRDVGVQISRQDPAFNSGIARSYGNSGSVFREPPYRFPQQEHHVIRPRGEGLQCLHILATTCHFLFSFLYIYSLFIYFWETASAWERGRERERERERESQTGSTLSSEPDMGLDLTNCEIMTWAKIQIWTLNWLSHPGTPCLFLTILLCSFFRHAVWSVNNWMLPAFLLLILISFCIWTSLLFLSPAPWSSCSPFCLSSSA